MNRMPTKVWYETAWFCAACQHPLTQDERYWNEGRCRHCGARRQKFIVESFERPVRCSLYVVRDRRLPWWLPIRRKVIVREVLPSPAELANRRPCPAQAEDTERGPLGVEATEEMKRDQGDDSDGV